MTSKQKSYNPEELLSTGQRTEQQLNELISMIGDILQLMEQLNMECNLAYREYQKVLHMLQDTLQQLKHSNEDMYSDVTCLQVTSPSPSNLLFDFSHLEEEPPLKGAASEESSLDPNNSKTLAVPSVPKALLSPFKAGGSPSKVPKALPDNARTTGFSLFGRRKNHPFGQGKPTLYAAVISLKRAIIRGRHLAPQRRILPSRKRSGFPHPWFLLWIRSSFLPWPPAP